MWGPGGFGYCFTANGGGGGYLPLACVPHVDRWRPGPVMTGGLWPPAVPVWTRLQTSDYSKEMDDLVTGQSPSAHLFPGDKPGPAARPRPCFWMHVASRRQSAGAVAASSSRLLADRWRARCWGGLEPVPFVASSEHPDICVQHRQRAPFLCCSIKWTDDLSGPLPLKPKSNIVGS